AAVAAPLAQRAAGHPLRIVLCVLAGLGGAALLLQPVERVPPEQRRTCVGRWPSVSWRRFRPRSWRARNGPAGCSTASRTTHCPVAWAGPGRPRYCSARPWGPQPDATTGPPPGSGTVPGALPRPAGPGGAQELLGAFTQVAAELGRVDHVELRAEGDQQQGRP